MLRQTHILYFKEMCYRLSQWLSCNKKKGRWAILQYFQQTGNRLSLQLIKKNSWWALLLQIYSIFIVYSKRETGCPCNQKKKNSRWALIQQIYSIFTANGQQVVPVTIMEKKKLVSLAPVDLFNILSRWTTVCPCNYYEKKKKSWWAILQQTYSKFSANRIQVVSITTIQKINK